MTTATKAKTRRTRNANRDKLARQHAGSHLLGQVVSWSVPKYYGTTNPHKDVVQALKDNGFDPDVAREFTKAQAFGRAINKLENEEHRVIDVIRRDKDEILFQFSKPLVEDDKTDGDKKLDYTVEAKVKLNTATGKLECKDPVVLEQARTLLEHYLEHRTTSDISNIVTKLFEDHADLFAFTSGCYFVPQKHADLVGRVRDFLRALGRDLFAFPVPAGTQDGDENVCRVVESHFTAMAQDLTDKIDKFDVNTRPGTVEAMATDISVGLAKMEAYEDLFQERKEDCRKLLEQCRARLAEKMEDVEEKRKTLPPSEQGSNRQRVWACVNGTPKTVKELCEEAGTNQNGIGAFLEIMVSKGRAVRTGNAYKLA